MLQKPPHGKPCNGCGQCCLESLCPLGSSMFGGEDGPCPALQRTGEETFGCGLVRAPELYAPLRAIVIGRERLSEAAAYLIGADIGCDAQLVGEPADQEFRKRLHRIRLRDLQQIAAAMEAWGVAEERAA